MTIANKYCSGSFDNSKLVTCCSSFIFLAGQPVPSLSLILVSSPQPDRYQEVSKGVQFLFMSALFEKPIGTALLIVRPDGTHLGIHSSHLQLQCVLTCFELCQVLINGYHAGFAPFLLFNICQLPKRFAVSYQKVCHKYH